MSSRATGAVTLVLLIGAAPLGAQTTAYQFWPELDTYVRLGPAARLFFLLAPVRERGVSGLDEAQVGAHFEVGLAPIRARRGGARAAVRTAYDTDRLRYLRARVGVRRTFTFDEGVSASETRVIAELTPRAVLPLDVHGAWRNRADFRWIEGEYSWRYRPRLWLEREVPVGAVTLVPYVSGEVFYDSRYHAWSRARYQLGMAVPVTSWLASEAYYAHQRDTEPSEAVVQAIGLVATLYF